MILILGGILGGVGFVFMGMKLLSEHLKSLADRNLRQSAERWTQTRWSGYVWGVIAGAVTQTMPALTFVTVGMLKSGLLSTRRAFPILSGGNVGAVLLLLVVMFDIKLAVLYVLGALQFAAMIANKDRSARARFQTIATALFGMGMMIFGFVLLKDSVAPLASYPWFQETVARSGSSLLLCLAVGVVLFLVMQSTGAVMVSGISMAAVGILGIEQILLLHAGACIASSLSVFLFTMNLTGKARQVAMYQVLHNCVLCAIFVPLIFLEAHFDVPLFKAAILSSDLPLPQLLALYCVGANLTAGIVQLAGLGAVEKVVEKWWPTTEAEVLSKPRFIHDRALDDAQSSLRLADREQRRLLEILSRCLDAVRQGATPGPLHEAAKEVLNRIKEFLEDLAALYPDHSVDDHIPMLTRQRLLFWLDERVLELCRVLDAMPRQSALEAWRMGLVEGLDAVLLTLHDTLSTNDEDSWELTARLIDDRSELMHKMRSAHLKEESALSQEERTGVLRITSIAEHVFLLLSALTREYQQAPLMNAAAAIPQPAEREEPAAVGQGFGMWPATPQRRPT